MDGAPIGGFTRTTTQLLDALADHGSDVAWIEVDARFRPVIAGLARRIGLPAVDAEDVAQQALSEFVRAYRAGRYDRTAGRLSAWMLGIARNTALTALRGRRRQTGPDGNLDTVADEASLRGIWDEERDRSIVHGALAMLRRETSIDDRTLRAFELVALRGVPAAAAATECGMTVDQVYVARSRVTRRLREFVNGMTEAFEADV